MIRRFGLLQLLAFVTMLSLLGACARQSSQTALRNGLGPSSGDSVVVTSGSLVQPSSGASNLATVNCSIDSPSIVNARETVTLTVRASGGYAPYTLAGYGTFASQQSISGLYDNYGSNIIIVDRTFQILDSQGNAGVCQLRIAVRPYGSTGGSDGGSGGTSASSCTIVPSNISPQAGLPVNFTVSVSPSSAFTLTSVIFQSDWQQTFNQAGTGSLAVNNVIYNTRGARTVYANVTVNGTAISCNTSIMVRKPKVYLVAEAGSVPGRVGSPIYLNLIQEDLAASPAPAIVLSSVDAGIRITQLTATRFKVEALDNLGHNFIVRASVSQVVGGVNESYIAEIPLIFATVPPLTCELAVPNNILTGSQISIPVRAVGVADSIAFDTVEVGGDAYVQSATGNPILVTFATAGTRVVRVRNARSLVTGAKCNGTGDVSQSVSVTALVAACDAIVSPRPALVGTLVKASANVVNSSGQSFSLVISASGSFAQYFQDLRTNSGLEHMVRFRRAGVYPLQFAVTNLSNNQNITCQTSVEVRPADTFVVSGSKLGNTVRVYKGRYGVEILAAGGFAPFADVLPAHNGGIRAATADVNGDGVLDIIAGAQTGGGLLVRAFDGRNLTRLYNWQAFNGAGTDAVRTYIAAGDVNGDGFADTIVGVGCLTTSGSRTNNSLLEIYSGKDGSRLSRFNALEGMSGVRVAAGDVDGDGYSDVIAASCSDSKIRVFSGAAIAAVPNIRPVAIKDFEAWPNYYSSQTMVGAADVNGDGYADIITGSQYVLADQVKVFNGRPGASLTPIFTIKPFNYQYGNNFVAGADLDGDGLSDVLVGGDGTYPYQTPEIKAFGSLGYSELIGPSGATRIIPFGTNFCSQLYLGAGTGGL